MSALIVAFTTLAGFAPPSDLASTSLTPALSSTATHSTTCDDTCTVCCRLYHDAGCAEFAMLHMRHCTFVYRYIDQILLSVVDSLLDSFLYFLCLSLSFTYDAVTVAQYAQSQRK
jgi:acyl-CoA synthetase (AMP-forming)/AMP-acid ligase II